MAGKQSNAVGRRKDQSRSVIEGNNSQGLRTPGANHGEPMQCHVLSPDSQMQHPSSALPLTEENLAKLNKQLRCAPAEDVYRICLAQGHDTILRLRNSAYEQQWSIIGRNNEDIGDVLECFGLLSVEHVEVDLFTIPNSEATPRGRFLADIPDGINRRVYDLADRSFMRLPSVKKT